MTVPDSNPRASAGVSVGILQILTLADGTFFPPGHHAIPWGRASGPAGLAPEALEECVYSFKVFSPCHHCARHLFLPASTVFQPALAVPCACVDIHLCSVNIQEV
jgi:hypothetical protein